MILLLFPKLSINYVHAALKFCYVHPDGVESQSLLQLRVHGDSDKSKEVFIEQLKGSVKVYLLLYTPHSTVVCMSENYVTLNPSKQASRKIISAIIVCQLLMLLSITLYSRINHATGIKLA